MDNQKDTRSAVRHEVEGTPNTLLRVELDQSIATLESKIVFDSDAGGRLPIVNVSSLMI